MTSRPPRSTASAYSLEDTAERYRKILNSAKDGIIALDPHGCIDGVNPAIEQMFGYSERDLIGHGIQELYETRPSDGEVRSFLEYVRSRGGTTSSREFRGRRADGSTLLCEVSVTPMELSDGVHYVSIVRDITERKRIEELKDQFVATVSHELRTPLTSIAGSLGLLAGGVAGELPPSAVKLIRIAHENSKRLVRLINDILDIEKIESGKMPFEVRPLQLRALVEQSIEGMSGFASEYGIPLELAPGFEDAVVLADADRLMQVMSNLLSNAIKFSPAGEKVLIWIERVENRYRVTIRNGGEGIPEEFRNRIFSRFAQADGSSTRQQGGTGLGLNIVREIIAHLKGNVGFDSAPGEGASFYFELPAAQPGEMNDGEEVLVCIPDGVAPQSPAPRELKDRISFVSTVDELRLLMGTRRFSAIILDAALTDDCRDEIIQLIKQDPASAGTSVVVMADGSSVKTDAQPLGAILEWLQKKSTADAAAPAPAVPSQDEVPHILHVEDDPDILSVTAEAFGDEFAVVPAATLDDARTALRGRRFNIIILDLTLGTESGLELLPELHQLNNGSTPVVIFSGYDVAPETGEAVKAVLTKSRVTLGQLVTTVRSLIKNA